MPKKKKEEPSKLPVHELIRQINKKHGSGTIKLASEADNNYILRRPCGIFSLDLATGGGLPAGTMVEIAGPEGAGKNLLADMYIAKNQEIIGDDFRCFVMNTEYKYDKLRARQNGVKIALSKKEIHDLEEAQGEPFTKEEYEELRTQIGEFYLIEGAPAEQLLDATIALVAHGDMHIGMIDSIAMLLPEEEMDKDHDESSRPGARATLQTKFMHKLHPCLNRTKTLLLGLNQVRAPLGFTGKYVPQYKISEAHAVRHGISGRIEISSGRKITDEQKNMLGKELKWFISKGKAGFHEGPSGVLDFYYDSGIDVLADFVEAVVPHCARSGAWYELSLGIPETTKFQGKKEVQKFFKDHSDYVEPVKEAIYKEKGIRYLYHETEEVPEKASAKGRRKNSKGRKGKTDAKLGGDEVQEG